MSKINSTYCAALADAQREAMRRDQSVFLMGIGLHDEGAVFGSISGVVDEFGFERCVDTPICEDTMTGVAIGASLLGMKAVHIHIRVDFMLLATNQIVNTMSHLRASSGGGLTVPVVVRAIVGRGWGQGCQHSKSMFSTYAHVPGLKVVAPSTPYDAKGMLLQAIADPSPTIFIEHRWLYWQTQKIPSGYYQVPFGRARLIQEGIDITIVAVSWMNVEAKQASELAEKNHGVSVELIDLRSISPLDRESILRSAYKTGRVIIADCDWVDYGVSAEIAACIVENNTTNQLVKVSRVGFKHCPCPTARHLENFFYPNALDLYREIESMLCLSHRPVNESSLYSHENRFKGPL
uniref:alpha-ketoacid dehydrogenase subunit beta n=1 Tax=Cyanobium sp. TaxID=2164130 RepID=UPI0040477968